MHPRTEATLQELRQSEWFRNVGVRDTQRADVLSSWDEAVESCASPDWEDLCLEAANQYRERLAEASRAEFARWNDVDGLVKPAAVSLVREKASSVVAAHQLPKVFVDTVEWDVLHLLMECEFADVHPPGFYASQAYWYANGHFPCGWSGEFPQGRLIIF